MTQLIFLFSTAFNILCGLYLLHEGARMRKANGIIADLVVALKALEAQAATAGR